MVWDGTTVDKILENSAVKTFSRLIMPIVGAGVVGFCGWAFTSAVTRFDSLSAAIVQVDARMGVIQAELKNNQDKIKDVADTLRRDVDIGQREQSIRINEHERRLNDHDKRIGYIEHRR